MERFDLGERMRVLTRGAALAAFVLTLGACTEIDNFLASIPAFSFMHESPAFDPYESPRPPPENAVPFASPKGVSLPPLPAVSSEAYLVEFAEEIGPNPLPVTPETIAAGQELYLTYCAVCHGPTGAGDGPVVGAGKFPPLVPDLSAERTLERTDGYLYAISRAGRGLMPAYATQTTHRERWLIVTYVRQLQRQAAQGAAQGGGSAEGGE